MFALGLMIFLSVPSFRLSVFAQNSKAEIYNANLLVKKGAGIESKSVLIAPEKDLLKISGGKDRAIDKSFSYASIKSADYAYSDKPQIREAIVLAMLVGNYFGAAMLFSKTKKHWLVLNTETESIYLELQQNSYRRLLFDLNANGINLSDSGDRDSKQQPRPKPRADFTEGATCGEESAQAN